MKESTIRAADRALARHPEFGDSSAISTLAAERNEFGLELFASVLPGVARSLDVLATWDTASTNELFADPLIQFSIERAFEDLACGELASPHELEKWLDVAMEAKAQRGKFGLVRDQMVRPWSVANGLTYLWDLPRSNPVTAQLERNFRAHFMTGRDVEVVLVPPTEQTAGALERACALFAELLPETASSVFRHVSAIALAVMRAGGGRLLTGSAGDGVPGTVILSPEEIDNPWDTAAHLLHEGLHEKFADITRFSSLVEENIAVEFPWRADEDGFTLARALSAFHVYIHFVLYEAAVRVYGERHFDRYGPLDAHPVSAHAMSVVRTPPGAYARGADRCRYLGEQLSTTWAPHLTPAGQRFVRWLLECIEPIGGAEFLPAVHARQNPLRVDVPAPARGYRKNPNLKERPLEEKGLLFAFVPELPRVQLLTLNAWLISELCDGSSTAEISERYLEIVGTRLSVAEAQEQLERGLHQLERSRVIERM